MSPSFPPNRPRDWTDLACSIGGAGILLYAVWRGQFVLAFLGVAIAVAFYGEWKRLRWATWALLGLYSFCLVALIPIISSRGLTLWRTAALAAIGYGLWTQGRELLRARRERKNADKPMISLALWEKASRPLDDRVLAEIVTAAWGGDFSQQDDNSAEFVVGSSPLFMVKSTHGMFVVHNFDRSYFEDAEKSASSLNELRCRKAATDHRAWIAVDWMGPAPAPGESPASEEIYSLIGRLVAELAGDDTLAVVHPETNRVYPWTPDIEQGLCDGQGLTALETISMSPVTPVNPDDPEMSGAIAEARRRWPEFVARFVKRHPEQIFSIKAPITVGDSTEHIWIEVTRIDKDTIEGQLGNEPVDLGYLHLGDPVTVPIDDIEDWVYVLTDTPVGAFTADVVRRGVR